MTSFIRIISVGAMLIFFSPLVAAASERGQELYQNHCRSCHESWVHTRKNSNINSIVELRQRVSGWSAHTGLKWNEEDIDDVTDYLSRHFYQLTDRP